MSESAHASYARARRAPHLHDREVIILVVCYLRESVGERLDPSGDERAGLRWIVVAHPRLEKVAEDVQRIRAARFAVEELAEEAGDLRARGIEMEIGNKQRGHVPL